MQSADSKEPVPKRQRQLRTACLNGDIATVKFLLQTPSPPRWKMIFQSLVGTYLSQLLGMEVGSQSAADLSYVYCDDSANMAIHYIAGGQTGAPRRLGLWGWPSPRRTEARRAGLYKFLLQHAPREALESLNPNAVNGCLETPLHCAIKSSSSTVAHAILDAPESGVQSSRAVPEIIIDAEDLEGRVPLDIALRQGLWPVARLLIARGALQAHCPGYKHASSRLRSWTAWLDSDEQADVAGRGIISEVGQMSKKLLGGLAGRVLRAASSSIGYCDSEDHLLEEAMQEYNAGPGPSTGGRKLGAISKVYTNTSEVARDFHAAAEYIAGATGMDLSTALLLLLHHSGRRDWIVEQYTASPEQFVEAVGGQLSNLSSRCEKPRATDQCIVCFDELMPEQCSVQLACGHVCCDDCWAGLLAARLSDGDVHRTSCPAEGCHLPLPLPAVQRLLPPPEYERYSRLLGQKVGPGYQPSLSCFAA